MLTALINKGHVLKDGMKHYKDCDFDADFVRLCFVPAPGIEPGRADINAKVTFCKQDDVRTFKRAVTVPYAPNSTEIWCKLGAIKRAFIACGQYDSPDATEVTLSIKSYNNCLALCLDGETYIFGYKNED